MSAMSEQVERVVNRTILQIVRDNHEKQKARLNQLMLYAMLNDLFMEISEDSVVTRLQDLAERGYLTCEETRDRKTHAVTISKIQITPRGRDVLLGRITDPAVEKQ